MIIAVDFDGTCVTHEYPETGKDIGAAPILTRLVEQDHKLILFTMRGNVCLGKAVDWFRENEIELYGINTNPTQDVWTTSPKAYAELYIDDAALGVPLISDELCDRPYVDWSKVEDFLTLAGILRNED